MCTLATKNKKRQLAMNVLCRIMRTFAPCCVKCAADIASDALCFFPRSPDW